jgi:hypothetical protein
VQSEAASYFYAHAHREKERVEHREERESVTQRKLKNLRKREISLFSPFRQGPPQNRAMFILLRIAKCDIVNPADASQTIPPSFYESRFHLTDCEVRSIFAHA